MWVEGGQGGKKLPVELDYDFVGKFLFLSENSYLVRKFPILFEK